MSLVQVQYGIIYSQGFQNPNAANSENYFLPQSLFRVSGIKSVRDAPIPGIVGLVRGVY